MTTAIFLHEAAFDHVTPPGHPERVDRYGAVLQALDAPQFAGLERLQAPPAADADLLRVHPEHHLARLRDAAPADGWAMLDPDTPVMAGSWPAALRGAGAAVAAVDRVLDGAADNAFSALRPPGHHAERTRAMGFCQLSNIAVAALHALDQRGLDRVAVVDFDVHHGNGTQDALWDEPRATFISTHQWPLYPGTGAPSERGAHDQILNLPLEAGTRGVEYRRVFEQRIAPALMAARPDLILVSAGFDAHRDDPLGGLGLAAADFGWITARLCALAGDLCDGRLVSVLEGGYDLPALRDSVTAHVAAMAAPDQTPDANEGTT